MNTRTKFPAHGYAGLAIILAAEILLFAGDNLIGRWFTPIIWTGFIFVADALLYKYRGRSPLVSDRREFLFAAIISVGGWWLFELYNAPRFWRSDLELWWHYHNLEPNLFLRRVGYDWAFATIFPALFLAAELFHATLFKNHSNFRPVRFSKRTLYALILVGAAGAILPLVVVSKWLVPIVWLSWIALLDPVNALRGSPSITTDLARGDYRRLLSLLASGAVCGVLWEFWNYWAITKWTYTVPYLGHVKIFEMPVLGYFGFPPFAVECWAMYVFCRSLLEGEKSRAVSDDAQEVAGIWMPD